MNWNQALFPSLKRRVDARSRKCREATLVRADGVARSASPIGRSLKKRSAKSLGLKSFAELTTPSAALRRLRAFLLMPQPPLLCKEGNVSALKQSANSFTRSDALGWYVDTTATWSASSRWNDRTRAEARDYILAEMFEPKCSRGLQPAFNCSLRQNQRFSTFAGNMHKRKLLAVATALVLVVVGLSLVERPALRERTGHPQLVSVQDLQLDPNWCPPTE